MTPSSIWPIAFGIVSTIALVLNHLQKIKNPKIENPKDIKRIDVVLERHENDLKTGTEKIHSLSTKIDLVSQTVGFMKETQTRMDKCQQEQTKAIQSIQVEIPKIEEKLREGVSNIFDDKLRTLKALLDGSGKDKKI